MKHVVLFSGGVISALVAIEVVRRFGRDDVVLLNHDISPLVESLDTKRFKQEVATYLGLNITFANHSDWITATPIKVCVESNWSDAKKKIKNRNLLMMAEDLSEETAMPCECTS